MNKSNHRNSNYLFCRIDFEQRDKICKKNSVQASSSLTRLRVHLYDPKRYAIAYLFGWNHLKLKHNFDGSALKNL